MEPDEMRDYMNHRKYREEYPRSSYEQYNEKVPEWLVRLKDYFGEKPHPR